MDNLEHIMGEKLMKISSFLVILAIIIGTIHPQSVPANEEESLEEIVYALPYEFNSFSYYTGSSYGDNQWQSAIYSTLMKRSMNENQPWVPDLVFEMPQVSEDGKTFSFVLKEDLLFSNNEPLTAHDVEFSLHAVLSPEIGVRYRSFVEYLTKESITVSSETEFSITLTEVTAFPHSSFNFPIIPKANFESRYNNCIDGINQDCVWNANDGSDAIGSGPFQVGSIDSSFGIIHLEANPNYFDAKMVKTDILTFKSIMSRLEVIAGLSENTIDIGDPSFNFQNEEFGDPKPYTEYHSPSLSTQELALNHLHPYFGTGKLLPENFEASVSDQLDDARLVRQAMSHVMPRDTYVNEILDGLGQSIASTMPPAAIGWDPSIFPHSFDITQARELMELAGFDYNILGEENEDGQYNSSFFEITILSSNTNPARNTWAENYAEQLPKIGIGVKSVVFAGWAELLYVFNPDPIELNQILQLYDQGGYDVFFAGYQWGIEWNPEGLFDSDGRCDTGNCNNIYNFDIYENQTNIADKVREYMQDQNQVTRIQKVEELQRLLYNELPTIPILSSQEIWALNDQIQGVDPILLSLNAQSWEKVTKEGFTLNEVSSEDTKSEIWKLNFAVILIIPTLISLIAIKKFVRICVIR